MTPRRQPSRGQGGPRGQLSRVPTRKQIGVKKAIALLYPLFPKGGHLHPARLKVTGDEYILPCPLLYRACTAQESASGCPGPLF